MTGDRQAREAAGRRAEGLAAFWLGLKGYRILARRFRAPGGELDLIAAWPFIGPPRRIAFVEVKQRADSASLAEAISPVQRRRIEAAADGFLAVHPKLSACRCGFDAVYVTPGHLPRHVPDLWRRGE